MKKTLYILLALLLGLVSCTMNPFDGLEPAKPEESGLVSVIMQLQVPVPLQAFTKASNRDSIPHIDYIKVAVFGTSGYPQAYSLAEPVDADGNPVASYAVSNDSTCYFKVLLPVYEGRARVHIIANGDESIPFVDQKEETIMDVMKSENNAGAYWAYVILEDGILPQKDDNGIMTTDGEGNFLPDAETARHFSNLILVRNFAEVLLTNESDNLTDITWTLVHVPTMGSVAPMAGGTYVQDFAEYTYDADKGYLVNGEEIYDGFMFENSMNHDYPESTDITTPVGQPNFVYERYKPSGSIDDPATCILVKAKFKHDGETDQNFTYYRIDLMDEAVGGYFPILRNYKYKVKIHKVGDRGADSIEEAMLRDSGGNVSMSTEAQTLTDISDGASRLLVEYVEKSFTSKGKKTLWVQYIPDVTKDEDHNGEADVDNTNVSISIQDFGLALKDSTITLLPSSSLKGYYIYEFEVKDQDDYEDLVSVLQVKAHNNPENVEDSSKLYRSVTIRVLKKMSMDLSLNPKQVSGTDTTVLNITLPDDLPSSIFPLEFYIEDINHTLNPTQKDGSGKDIKVPVKTAKSFADGNTNSFYFIRTVNESDYLANHTISTQFQTVQNPSATTLYVKNEYFSTQTINLLNSGIYVNPTNATVAFDVTSYDVEVETVDENAKWTVTTGAGVTVNVTGEQTGSKTFTMSFDENTETGNNKANTVTVSSGGVSQTVTITQTPLKVSISPVTQTVEFNETSATLRVSAPEGVSWTASVTGGAELAEGSASGEGSKDITVNFQKNLTDPQKEFKITVTIEGYEDIELEAIVYQKQKPNYSYTFNRNSYTGSGTTWSQTSSDELVTVRLAEATRGGGTYNRYFTMGRVERSGNISSGYTYTTYPGSITITPSSGIVITGITVTYSSETYANYDFGNNHVTVSSGTYTQSRQYGEWDPDPDYSTGVVIISNGFQNNNNNYSFPQIQNIVVTYEPVD